jgi:hypothetical protein
MKPMLILMSIAAGLAALLALPPTLKKRSWRTFLMAAVKSFAGIVLPLLAFFWSFEELWREAHPAGHARFRRFYNVVGPRLARRVTNPWLADITYLLLKPVETGAGLVLALKKGGEHHGNH